MDAAEFRVFLMSDKHDRRYVSVRVACGFNLMKKILPDAWMANEKEQRGYHNIIGTSVCVALIFERAGGTSEPGPPLAARNSSGAHGTTPDEGSLL